jgi:hypothetical protein
MSKPRAAQTSCLEAEGADCLDPDEVTDGVGEALAIVNSADNVVVVDVVVELVT